MGLGIHALGTYLHDSLVVAVFLHLLVFVENGANHGILLTFTVDVCHPHVNSFCPSRIPEPQSAQTCIIYLDCRLVCSVAACFPESSEEEVHTHCLQELLRLILRITYAVTSHSYFS